MTDDSEKLLRAILAAQTLTLKALVYLVEQGSPNGELGSPSPPSHELGSEARGR